MRLALRTRVFGKKIYWYPRLESTMKVASSLAEKGEAEGTIVIAEEQTQGEGRGGHYWFSPSEGLWFSLILRPCISASLVPRLNIMGAVGIVESIRELMPLLSPRIRWPNDAVVNKRKVSGVLCKACIEQERVNFVIMGIGINLNIEDFPAPLCFTATSLKREAGYSIPRGIFLGNLLRELEELYLLFQEDFSSILEKARLFSSLLGRQIKIDTEKASFSGWAQDLDEDGNLVLRLQSGVLRRIGPEEGYVQIK